MSQNILSSVFGSVMMISNDIIGDSLTKLCGHFSIMSMYARYLEKKIGGVIEG